MSLKANFYPSDGSEVRELRTAYPGRPQGYIVAGALIVGRCHRMDMGGKIFVASGDFRPWAGYLDERRLHPFMTDENLHDDVLPWFKSIVPVTLVNGQQGDAVFQHSIELGPSSSEADFFAAD